MRLPRFIDRAAARDLAGSCLVGDLHDWGPDADPDPDNVGTVGALCFSTGPEGCVAIDLTSPRGDRRLIINEKQLQVALRGAGFRWVKPLARKRLAR